MKAVLVCLGIALAFGACKKSSTGPTPGGGGGGTGGLEEPPNITFARRSMPTLASSQETWPPNQWAARPQDQPEPEAELTDYGLHRADSRAPARCESANE